MSRDTDNGPDASQDGALERLVAYARLAPESAGWPEWQFRAIAVTALAHSFSEGEAQGRIFVAFMTLRMERQPNSTTEGRHQ